MSTSGEYSGRGWQSRSIFESRSWDPICIELVGTTKAEPHACTHCTLERTRPNALYLAATLRVPCHGKEKRTAFDNDERWHELRLQPSDEESDRRRVAVAAKVAEDGARPPCTQQRNQPRRVSSASTCSKRTAGSRAAARMSTSFEISAAHTFAPRSIKDGGGITKGAAYLKDALAWHHLRTCQRSEC